MMRRGSTGIASRAAGAGVCVLLGASLTSCAGGEPEAPGNSFLRWTVSDEIALSIGELDGEEAYVLSRVAGVVLLDDGGVAVADGGSSTIRVFDADGEVRRVSGGPGEGPGEYEWMNQLVYRPPDTLVVLDSGLGRLTELSGLGESVAATVSLRADDGRVEVYLGRFEDGSHALAWIDLTGIVQGSSKPEADPMRIARFGADGTRVAVLAEDVGMRRLGPPTPFSPHFQGAVVGDVVLHGDGLHPRLRRTDRSGETGTPLEVDLPRTTLDAAWASYEPVADSADLARFAELRGTAGLDSVPAFSALLVDDFDRIWLKAYDPRTDSHWAGRPRTGGTWLVVEPDGATVARVSVPRGFRLMDVRGDAVVGVARDELGVERVQVRALERGAG